MDHRRLSGRAMNKPHDSAPVAGAPVAASIGAMPATPFAWGLTVLRTVLGLFFAFAGVAKLRDVRLFAFGVRAFEFGLDDEMVNLIAHSVPWIEVLAGSALLLGIAPRSAALVLMGAMGLFIAGILSLLWRDLDVDCPCFGSMTLVCRGPLGACHLIRNALLAIAAWVIVWRGGGRGRVMGP